MDLPLTEIVVSKDGVEILRRRVPPGRYVFGRARECELAIDAGLISRRHAQLTIEEDQILVEDLASANGTFIDGESVGEATPLLPNQTIRIGSAIVKLRRVPSEPTAEAPQATAPQALPAELLRPQKYDVGSLVARGGMGAIMNATELATGRTVAMKVVLQGSPNSALTRFVSEARITAQLEHPNIVPVHELSVDEHGRPFYTMKMVRGITLQKVIDLLIDGQAGTVKKYGLPALLTIFQKLCDAVAFAHSKGVIHRDLKPENVMLGDFGEVLVMDWGLAKLLHKDDSRADAGDSPDPSRLDETPSMTLDGAIMGTPRYMSPEQARGEVATLDPRSDIYALGAVLYHLLALRPPVKGRTVMEIVSKVGEGFCEPLTAAKAGPSSHLPAGRVPESLGAVVRKAMAFDRGQRYADVAQLQRDLAAYQNGFATGAERAGFGRQMLLALKRHKAVATSVAAALLVLALVVAAAFVRVTGEKNRATANEHRALDALGRLRGTAPTFFA
jgi:eukaryotic-like serine/threonine-protein kinase